MNSNKKANVASLLLALGLLLGITITGCSSSGNNGSGGDVTTEKTITYYYEMDTDEDLLAKGVPAKATHMKVSAFDKSKNQVKSRVDKSALKDQLVNANCYAAITRLANEADSVEYAFYYTDDKTGEDVTVCTHNVSVRNIPNNGDTSDADAEVAQFAMNITYADGSELVKLRVGDVIAVKLFSNEQDITSLAEVKYDESKFKRMSGDELKYTAKAEGEATFNAYYNDELVATDTVYISQAAPTTFKEFNYVYTIGGNTVPDDAEKVRVTAYDTDGYEVPASITGSDKVSDQGPDPVGKYRAATKVRTDAAVVTYNFYKELDEGTAKYSVCCRSVKTSDITGKEVSEDKSSDETYKVEICEPNGNPLNTVAVNDFVVAKVFANEKAFGYEHEMTDRITFVGDRAGKLLPYDDVKTHLEAAVSGETEFFVILDDIVIFAANNITVNAAPTYNSIDVCPEGYYTSDGKLYKSNGDKALVPSTINIEAGRYYTLVAVVKDSLDRYMTVSDSDCKLANVGEKDVNIAGLRVIMPESGTTLIRIRGMEKYKGVKSSVDVALTAK